MTAAYLTSCPNCGGQLDPVALGPGSAPWLCTRCRIGWWVAELGADARTAWDPLVRSLGWQARFRVEPAVAVEAAAAAVRGTSALPEQLPQLSAVQLRMLAGLVPAGVFAGQVQAALKARGGVG